MGGLGGGGGRLPYYRKLKKHLIKVIPCFAVHSSSVHEGKIIIFERFHSSLTKIIQLNCQLVF